MKDLTVAEVAASAAAFLTEATRLRLAPTTSLPALHAILDSAQQVRLSGASGLRSLARMSDAGSIKLRPACFLSAGLSLHRPQELSAMITARQCPASIVAQGNLLIKTDW